MKTIEVNDIHEFLEFLAGNMDTGKWGFRGVPSSKFDLIPSIARPGVRQNYDYNLEKYIFHRFRQMAIPFDENGGIYIFPSCSHNFAGLLVVLCWVLDQIYLTEHL